MLRVIFLGFAYKTFSNLCYYFFSRLIFIISSNSLCFPLGSSPYELQDIFPMHWAPWCGSIFICAFLSDQTVSPASFSLLQESTEQHVLWSLLWPRDTWVSPTPIPTLVPQHPLFDCLLVCLLHWILESRFCVFPFRVLDTSQSRLGLCRCSVSVLGNNKIMVKTILYTRYGWGW